MGKIIVSENVTLDGVGQDPTGEEGFRLGGWFGRISDADRAAWAGFGLEEALGVEAMLLGRTTYEFLAARWTARTGAWADRLNGLPKYVVSSTLTDPAWANTTVLTGDPVTAAKDVAARTDGGILVAGSGRLARTLLEHGLVGELRLMVFPFVLGDGDRPLGGNSEPRQMRLTGNRALGDNLVLLTYESPF